MNLKSLVKLSNIVALVSIVLLIYWVFVFIATNVFGFKIFRERITETFAMSVFGIFALMAGSLMINVMFNLTRIAERHNQDGAFEFKKISAKLFWAFILAFPIIFGLLYGGDYLTSKKKENFLIASAKSVVEINPQKTDALLNYRFDKNWLTDTASTLDLMSKTDESFPSVSVVTKDEIDGMNVFLNFKDYETRINREEDGEKSEPQKKDFIFKTTPAERDYLSKVFDEGYNEIRFEASSGNYKLYYPYFKDGKRIVLYFSDYQRYGKLGS